MGTRVTMKIKWFRIRECFITFTKIPAMNYQIISTMSFSPQVPYYQFKKLIVFMHVLRKDNVCSLYIVYYRMWLYLSNEAGL